MAEAEAETERPGEHAPAEDSAADLPDGAIVEGRYRIAGVLGEGGVGVVYLADDLKLPRQVAIKVLQARYADHTTLRTRFEREARALAALSHPNIVQVSDYGVTYDKPFVVMELLHGKTLRQLLDEGDIAPQRVFGITRQLLKGLSYAHSRGLVHRDIKPGNIFLQRIDDDTELVKILDFGFAKFLSGDGAAAHHPDVSQEGQAFGTPSYLAPEQATGASTDTRADVYSVGVVLFEMLAGSKPFQGSLIDIVRAHLTAKVPRISSVSKTRKETPELQKLIERAMAKKPEQRYEDASAFLRALDALPTPAIHVRARRAAFGPGRIFLVIVAVALVAAATQLLMSPDPRGTFDGWMAAGRRAVGMEAETPSPAGADEGQGGGAEQASAEGGEGAAGEASGEGEGAAGGEEGAGGEESAGGEEGGTEGGSIDEAGEARAAVLLAEVRAALDANRPVPDASIDELRTYVRHGRDLAGAHLLLGHVYSSRGWLSDAIHHYEQAHDADARVKADPLMLKNLVGVTARSPNLDIESDYLVQTIWGAEAIPAVDEALAEPGLAWDGRTRLQRLRRRLERMQ